MSDVESYLSLCKRLKDADDEIGRVVHGLQRSISNIRYDLDLEDYMQAAVSAAPNLPNMFHELEQARQAAEKLFATLPEDHRAGLLTVSDILSDH